MDTILLGIGLGFAGTVIGALVTMLIGKNSNDTMICYMLSFAGGVMASIVFFELVPEAIKMSSVPVAAAGMALGVGAVLFLNTLVDRVTGHSGVNVHSLSAETHTKNNSKELARKRLMRLGLMMLIAIGLHNLPEGLAVGAAGVHNVKMGFSLAMVVALHNIPEGMAISAPLTSGGMSRWKALLWITAAELPALLGALIGFYVGGVSEIVSAVCLAVAGGAMLYIVFGEIIPQSLTFTKSRHAALITLFGVAVGLLMVQI